MLSKKGEIIMKRGYIVCSTIALLFVVLICALVIPRSNTKNAIAVISSDYSTITYKGNVYIPIQTEMLPLEVKRSIDVTTANDMIKATVENENYFLDKCFFTNYIAIKEYEGEIFIYLHTDYDVNESDYYCSQTYKDIMRKQ